MQMIDSLPFKVKLFKLTSTCSVWAEKPNFALVITVTELTHILSGIDGEELHLQIALAYACALTMPPSLLTPVKPEVTSVERKNAGFLPFEIRKQPKQQVVCLSHTILVPVQTYITAPMLILVLGLNPLTALRLFSTCDLTSGSDIMASKESLRKLPPPPLLMGSTGIERRTRFCCW